MESVDQLLSSVDYFGPHYLLILLPFIMIYVVQHKQYLQDDPGAVLTNDPQGSMRC